MYKTCRLLFATLAIIRLIPQDVQAQSEVPKLEAGVVFTAIRQSDDFFNLVPEFNHPIRHNFGYGGRLGFNATKFISLEGEISFFPKERFLFTSGLFPGQVLSSTPIGGTRTQGLFGVKAGNRTRRFGAFGKLRPGFMRFSKVADCPNGEVVRCTYGGKSEFALDIGGVFEYYPTHRLVVRFDAGDTIIRFEELTRANFFNAPPDPRFPLKRGGGTTNNAQYSVGIGIRF